MPHFEGHGGGGRGGGRGSGGGSALTHSTPVSQDRCSAGVQGRGAVFYFPPLSFFVFFSLFSLFFIVLLSSLLFLVLFLCSVFYFL